MPIPISLIVDDGAPVNLMYFQVPSEKHEFLIPNSLLRGFADVCDAYSAAGKFTVMPMPSALGRVDRELNYVPKRLLDGFLKVVRERIVPRFDITVELLTHQMAIDPKSGRLLHVYEDAWASRASAGEIADYISLGLRILKNVGIGANGVTSPWMLGIDNEKAYAEGVARSQWRVFRRKFSWYFLHCLGRKQPRWPWLAWRDGRSGLKCVTVPANTADPFWRTQYPTSAGAARTEADAGINAMLSKDGRSGRIRELFDGGFPIVILTHWQSLFSNGRCAGLGGLERLFERIERTLGSSVRWTRCSKLARLAVS